MLEASELILNPDGTIYHLGLGPDDLCSDIITVGDPDRIDMVVAHFDEVYWTKSIREFCSARGRIGNKELLVVSTGIGTDNIDIVFSELDACANIDFVSRTIKPSFSKLNFYRLGTSGAIREDIELGTLLVSKAAIGLDALMHYYNAQHMEDAFSRLIKANVGAVLPQLHYYTVTGDEYLVEQFSSADYIEGITVTAPGFYGPQGRQLRLKRAMPDLLNVLSSITVGGIPITNLEMETAGIYGMSRALGHSAVSLNALLANRRSGAFADDPSKVVKRLIKSALGIISEI